MNATVHNARLILYNHVAQHVAQLFMHNILTLMLFVTLLGYEYVWVCVGGGGAPVAGSGQGEEHALPMYHHS